MNVTLKLINYQFPMNKHFNQRNYQLFVLFCLFALFSTTESRAQDIHFSQFYHSPLNLNPARTGVFQGDQRFVGNYRNQWGNVPTGYTTFSGAYDMKVFREGMDNSAFGLGLLFNYDQAGDGNLSLTNIALNLAYTHRLSQKSFLSVGTSLGVANRAFDDSGLTTNTQFNGELFSSALPTGEEDTGRDNSIFYLDFSAGLNYHYQVPRKRTRIDLGVAMFHINSPSVNFYANQPIDLASRINIFGEATFMLKQRFDIVGRALFQFQQDYNENLLGIAGRLHLKKNENLDDLAIQLGVSMRFNSFNDAFSPNVELHYNRWLFGLSYDINVSEFQRATNRQGGPELAIMYRIFNLKSLPAFKQCPIY